MTAIAAAAAQLDLASLYDDTIASHASYLQQLGWAEDEIEQGERRHPEAADVVWHSLRLTVPTGDLMRVEVVYRAHCRELIDRVAAGRDTRPGTAVEICLQMCWTSLIAPLNTSAAGLYFRAWKLAGLPDVVDGAHRAAYEMMRSSEIDDDEREARRVLAVSTRKLGSIDCAGKHHGEPVRCRYAPAADGRLF
jgi:hypothetical protein